MGMTFLLPENILGVTHLSHFTSPEFFSDGILNFFYFGKLYIT